MNTKGGVELLHPRYHATKLALGLLQHKKYEQGSYSVLYGLLAIKGLKIYMRSM